MTCAVVQLNAVRMSIATRANVASSSLTVCSMLLQALTVRHLPKNLAATTDCGTCRLHYRLLESLSILTRDISDTLRSMLNSVDRRLSAESDTPALPLACDCTASLISLLRPLFLAINLVRGASSGSTALRSRKC
jgi:hypothetical protein